MADTTQSTADRLASLFDRLGIARAHLLACMSGDWGEFVTRHPERVASLTIVAPHLNKGIPDGLDRLDVPALVVSGELGTPGERARDLAARFAIGSHATIPGYESPAWADTIADREPEVAAALTSYLARTASASEPDRQGVPETGEIAGLHYRVRGSGPAIFTLPLSMAPSQWEPLATRLSETNTVVQLGGPHLGVVSLLESRAASGYGDLVAQLLEACHIGPGARVLELGCGSGALARALTKRVGPGVSVVAADVNPYLLSEARGLMEGEKTGALLSFAEANAEALPYPDASFDTAYCCTLLEEVDADRVIAEIARVTRPGGRIAVMTRALDVDWWVNLDLPDALRRKIGALGPSTGSGVGPRGCADASLYTRLVQAGLTPVRMGLQMALYRGDDRLEDCVERLVAKLSGDEARACRAAVDKARADGTLLVGEPHHCAVMAR
jgi:SAM-dependent methyltransferase